MEINTANEIKVTLQEIFFYVYWGLMLFAKGIGWYDGELGFKICLVFGFICIFLKIATEKYTLGELLWMAVFVGLGGITYLNSGEKGMLIFIVLMIGLKNISVIRVFKVGGSVWLVTFIILSILSKLDLVYSPTFIHDKLGTFFIRYGFGYSHPNVFHMSYFMIMIFIMYLVKEKDILKTTLYLFIGNILVFIYSLSYTGVIAGGIYLLANYYLCKRGKLTRVEKIIIKAILPGSVIFSLLGPVLLNSEGVVFQLINKILNTRFYLSRIYLTTFPITFFGQSAETGVAAITMDCSYTFAFVKYGVILFLIIMIFYVALIHEYIKEDKRKELAIVISLLIVGISEPLLFNTSFKNPSFILMGLYLFQLSNVFYEKKCSILSNEIQLIPIKSKELVVNTTFWNKWNLKQYVEYRSISYKKRILVFIVSVILTIGISYSIEKPVSYIAPSAQCDEQEDGKFYIMEDELDDYADSIIFDYKGADTPMYEFSGDINNIENGRSAIIIYIVVCFLLMESVIIFEKRNSAKR